jgi:hypothetical protein
MGINALVLCCTLKNSPAESSSTLIGQEFLDALRDHDVTGEMLRVVDHDVRFGVSPDEGDGDEWPRIRQKKLAADIFVIATPIWLGQPSSVCKMVLERLDDTGFSVAAGGSTYWVGEAMQTTDYLDLEKKPEKTTETTKTAAANTAHLARLLNREGYPPA